jgi:hypothetical protein
MSWFSNILGKSNSNDATANSQTSDTMTEDSVDVLEGMFVNNNRPVQENISSADNSSSLRTYLEQDFFHKGFEDGYNGHSAELLENKILSMKADFRYNLSLKIDAARQEILKLENHKINVEGMSERLVKQLTNQVISIKLNITTLEAEIAFSTHNEGHVMISIHQYRDGFIRGTEAYQDEKLIAGSTGLFI